MRHWFVMGTVALFSMAIFAGTVHGAEHGQHVWAVDSQRLAAEAAKLDADSQFRNAPFFTYVVPAISSVRRLPDTIPVDGELSSQLGLVGALGEFVPASFVVAPLRDVSQLALTASDLVQVGGQGVIPASAVDIKVVKVWWGPGNSWFSYFADPTRRELVPDLLLNDENLVRVDLENQENYLRVDYPQGSEYVWVSYYYPSDAPQREAWQRTTLPLSTRFDYYKEPVEDSPVLLPVVLEEGRLKQFWVTVRVPEDAEPGIYTGTIAMTADGVAVGDMQLRMRVLPFTLPDPRTYFDVERPFFVAMDGMGRLYDDLRGFDGDQEMAEKRLSNLYRNQREHNMFQFAHSHLLSHNRHFSERNIARLVDDPDASALMRRQLELIRDAGFEPPLIDGRADITGMPRGVDTSDPEGRIGFDQYMAGVAVHMDMVQEILGHRDVIAWGRGEPSRAGLVQQLEGFEGLHELGVQIGQEGKPWHLPLAGYAIDMAHLGGHYFDRQYTLPWHLIGSRVSSYASPHPGAENPDYARRHHGMMLYKAGFDGTKNNVWISHRQNWLEFWNPYSYRISIIYPTQTDVINTLAYAGFREGIDDIRYATKLKMVALDAMARGDTQAWYTARKALVWLETKDEKTSDLNAMRLEIINRILTIRELMHGVE